MRHRLQDFVELCKPRVVALIVFTAIVGMFLAVRGLPAPWTIVCATIGIGLLAAAAAGLNQIIDRRIDARMIRTRRRPLVTGALSVAESLCFCALTGTAGFLLLWYFCNELTACLTLAALVGYAGIYTVFLKRLTPQNIVIGGAAGAAPPMLGWTAMTGSIHPDALILFLIIFVWTPPHFWALAISRRGEYARVGIPMLPVTHGVPYTAYSLLLYTVLLTLVSLLPVIVGMSGWIYAIGAAALDAIFLWYAVRLYLNPYSAVPMRMFRFSIVYLAGIFVMLLLDHYLVLHTAAL